MGAKLPKMKRRMESTTDNASFSLLEQMPHELMWEIIDYAPEAVLNLRLTCRALKSRVDAFVMLRAKTMLVNELRIISYSEQERSPRRMIISMNVYWSKKKRLELRLLNSPPENIISRINKSRGGHSMVYILDCLVEEKALIKHVRACIGWQINKVEIKSCRDKKTSDAICKLLKGVQIRRVDISDTANSNDFVVRLQKKLHAESYITPSNAQ